MKPPQLPENEQERIRKLEELSILDTIEEQAYDDLTFLAARICKTPIALVSLVDRERQWFKSHYGLSARETPRDLAFCAHAILGDDLFVVEDADKDVRFRDNPLVTDAPLVKFYAGAPLIMENNLRLGTLCVIADKPRTLDSEQRQALIALSRQVVSQLQLRIRLKQLERLDRSKDEFISMVSHELRTPLTSVRGALSLLQNKEPLQNPEQSRDLIDIAHRNTERLLTIVNDILDISKMEAGKLEISRKQFDLIQLLKHAAELNRVYCEKFDCKIKFDCHEHKDPFIIVGDELRLLQVLNNLISNAAKFTHKNDLIELGLTHIDGTAHVEVTDHGPGIPADQQGGLFQKFNQAGLQGNHKSPGTGLGLYICKQIIELHHGHIGVKSIPDQLTTFHFSLPAMK